MVALLPLSSLAPVTVKTEGAVVTDAEIIVIDNSSISNAHHTLGVVTYIRFVRDHHHSQTVPL